MLSSEARTRAEELVKIINEEISGKDTYSLTLGDIKWLAETLVEVDNRYKEHQNCCLPEKGKCAYAK